MPKSDIKLIKKEHGQQIAVAQLGARMHYAVPRILEEAGLLQYLYTDTYSGNKPRLRKIVSSLPWLNTVPFVKRWAGRSTSIAANKVISFDTLGLVYKVRRSFSERTADEIFATTGSLFAGCVSTRLQTPWAVWAFNTAALEVFRKAKKTGAKCILEQTMAPYFFHDEVMELEAQKWRDWQPSPFVSSPRLGNREREEWDLADYIVCPSHFVMQCLERYGVPSNKLRLVEYGYGDDPSKFVRKSPRQRRNLHVLFCGEVGLRKGFPYLLEAVMKMNRDDIELVAVGAISIHPKKCTDTADLCTYAGSVPREEVENYFRWADVLVLPSACEGSATVIYEALFHGLEVICTPNSGAPSHPDVEEVAQGSVLAIMDALCRRADGLEISVGAPKKDYDYDRYRTKLLALIDEISGARIA